MAFDWKKLEREDAERTDRSAFGAFIGQLAVAVVVTVLMLATGRFGERWPMSLLPCLMIGGPALIVWLRRRKRNGQKGS